MKRLRRIAIGSVVTVAMMGGAASAASRDDKRAAEKAVTDTGSSQRKVGVQNDTGKLRLYRDASPGVNITANAGVADYTGGLNGVLQPGRNVGVTVAAEPTRISSLEFGYQNSRNGIDDPRVGDDQAIYRHNVNVFAKLGPNLGAFRPFVGAGIGASYANASDGAEGLYRNDFYQELPVGAGLEFNSGVLTAGARATFTSLFNDEFAEPTPGADNPDSGFMTGMVNVGARF